MMSSNFNAIQKFVRVAYIGQLLSLVLLCSSILACTNQSDHTDNTLTGAVLGAGWGAGAGVIVGNQIGSDSAPSLVAGAGFGAVAGAMTGYSQDAIEDDQDKLERQLDSLNVQNMATRAELRNMQDRLDRSVAPSTPTAVYQIYFGDDETDLKAGATANLEVIAEALKKNPSSNKVVLAGHSDDSSTSDYSQRISEARARSVSSYFSARGISNDQIEIKGYGSTRPMASNSTPEGRQLNRRVDVYVSGGN